MGQTDSIRAVYVEGLGLGVCTATGSGISEMAQAHESRKLGHSRSVVENARGHAISLALVESSSLAAGDYASSILAAVLKQVQRIVNFHGCRLRLAVL